MAIGAIVELAGAALPYLGGLHHTHRRRDTYHAHFVRAGAAAGAHRFIFGLVGRRRIAVAHDTAPSLPASRISPPGRPRVERGNRYALVRFASMCLCAAPRARLPPVRHTHAHRWPVRHRVCHSHVGNVLHGCRCGSSIAQANARVSP
ncbi:hypothetical protein C7H84_29545 [Burkholderia sp. Nafp2/4-1b]|nr:hypothetical protein C7H84_29545 [Burkholderia sp. Nafp2/4-1b]